jgi:hypothetical protein
MILVVVFQQSFTFENDLAILHLAEPANLTDRIQVISFAAEGITFEGEYSGLTLLILHPPLILLF